MKNEKLDIFDLLKDVLSAVMVLSKIPVPWEKISDDPPEFNRSFWAFPIAGFILGLISGMVFLFFYLLSLPIIVSVSLAVFAGIFITGGLHEEGLANTFRAFFEGKDKDEIIELMKSSNIGTYSSLSLIILIIIKITALTSLGIENFWYVFAALIVSGTIGRSMIVFLRSISNSILRADEDDGANETEGNILWSSLGLSFLIAIIFSPFWVAISGYTLCVIQTYCFMAYCNKKIGGVSGNILGANEQISEIMFLLVFSAVYGAL